MVVWEPGPISTCPLWTCLPTGHLPLNNCIFEAKYILRAEAMDKNKLPFQPARGLPSQVYCLLSWDWPTVAVLTPCREDPAPEPWLGKTTSEHNPISVPKQIST